MVVSEKIGIFVAEITKHNSNMGKNIIEIGTKIKVNIQNKDIIGAVTNIQRCECGEKYGEDIDSVKEEHRHQQVSLRENKGREEIRGY